ncbi:MULTISPECIES: helix-turn-helix transcriptional regulator [unclassified Parafrankia]|uniref:helix-turn-helix domain-containing protein n=1 Tax=Parafrankia TaxID=2994362 RepID=UPI001F41F69A|nr:MULTISPECIES: helix-turn-helix transcriptional regulator [unclassified Parafrankia]
MTERGSDLSGREPVGVVLARLRGERGLTGERLGALVHMSQAKISKIERGVARPSPADVERIAVALDAPQALVASLVDQAGADQDHAGTTRGPARRGTVGQQDFSAEETRAHRIRNLEPILIPGLLQIGEYTRRVINEYFGLTHGDAESKWADTAATVSLRARRQELLYDPSREFEFVIFETVFRNRFAPPGAMLAQVDRVEAVAQLANVTVKVVPDTADLGYPPMQGFTILDDNVVLAESMDATILRDRKSVDFYTRFFDQYASRGVDDLEPILSRYKTLYADLARPRGDG